MTDDDANLHRLEGTSRDAPCGLIIKKEDKPADFQFAKPSPLGLDKVAAAKRKQNRLISFQNDENETEDNEEGSDSNTVKAQKYRRHNEETPTYTDGLSEQARGRMLERLQKNKKEREKGVHNSTLEEKKSCSKEEDDYRRFDRCDRDRDRRRDYDRTDKDRQRRRDSGRSDRSHSERDSSRRSYYEPIFKDEPKTPSFFIGVVDDGSSGSLLRGNPLEIPLHRKRQRFYQFYDNSANVLIDIEDNYMADVEMEPFETYNGGSAPGTPSSAPSTSTSMHVPPSSRRASRLDKIDNYVNPGSEDDSSSDEKDSLFTTFVPRSQRIFFDLGDDIDSPDSPAVPSPSREPQPSGEVSSIVASPEDWRPKGLFDFTWERFPSNPVPPNERREAFRSENVGPTDIFPSPYEAFVAIWTPDFVGKIVVETNRYAQQLTNHKMREGGLRPTSRITKWKDVTADTIYVYFALLIATGITIKTDIKEYWAKDETTCSPFFSRHMSYNQFLLINMCLHFVDNSTIDIETLTRQQAKLYKIQPVVRHLNSRFQQLYNLGKNIALDESLTGWKGWLAIRQHIRNKSAGIGIKTYEVCDSSTGYLWRFKVYAGREEGAATETEDLGYVSNLVLKLLEGLENKGHCIWMDNYYNSPALARVLKSKGFDCVGTLRTNRQGVPAEIKHLKNSDMTVGQISGCTSGDVDIVVWRDAKRVAMMSTYHGAAVHTAEMKTKPIVVYDYNVCMGGVDKKDQMLSTYPLERKRNRIWYKKFFKRLLNVSILNAFVLHRDSGTGHILLRIMGIIKDNTLNVNLLFIRSQNQQHGGPTSLAEEVTVVTLTLDILNLTIINLIHRQIIHPTQCCHPTSITIQY